MNYRLIPTDFFEKETKRLSKKFHSLKSDLVKFSEQLLVNPRSGSPLGGGAFKHRIAVRSKGRGKSGGMRVITYLTLDVFVDELTNIYLLAIYDKSETQTLSRDELRRLIGELK
ncbi:MAG: type II toxin-antitoxin system RelE/ParE family toxin [Ignavibacteriae bacterium]|nr:type II toxin-antitoxin system RelE/ParE family toxin [Ignavibacteriota bacterium]